MFTAVKVIFVGLSSFLNMQASSDPNLPAPSVIVHRDAHKAHTPIIAFDRTIMKVTPAISTPVASSNFDFILLDGLKLTIAEDTAGKPIVDPSFKDVARIADYAKLTMISLNHDRVPKRGNDPKSSEVAAYLLFGNGKITADWPTDAEYTFKNPAGVTTVGPKQFARRVLYTFPSGSTSVTIRMTPLTGSTASAGDLKFESTVGGDIEIWIANAEIVNVGTPNPQLGMKLELENFQPATPSAATHFETFYASLKPPVAPKDIYIPFPLVTSLPGGGPSSGLCGPDSLP